MLEHIQSRLKKLSGNSRIILKNSAGAFLVKGGSLLISMISMPAFIRYFGDQAVLGVWYTLLSVITWVDFFDLGVGNGLRNCLVKSLAEKQYHKAREQISSAYFVIGILTITLTIAGILLIPVADWNHLLNISPHLLSAGVLDKTIRNVFIGVMFHFFLKLISSIIYALQKSAINNVISLIGSMLRLLFVLVAPSSTPEENLLLLSKAYVFLTCLPYLIATVIVFATELKQMFPEWKYCRVESAKKVMGIGGVFFICQILYMLIINTNDFFITYYTGPENSTVYNIYYKLFSLAGTLATLALTPIWSMVTKAITEKAYGWLRKLYSRALGMMALVAIVQFGLICVSQHVVDLWLSESAIKINYGYAVVFALWGTIFVLQNVLSTFVCGLGELKLQGICYSMGVLLKYVMLWIVFQFTDQWIVVVISNIFVMVPYCIVQHKQLLKYLDSIGRNE